MFLDYSLNHQGYRCLDSSIGRVHLSRHVIFYESSFPFEETINTFFAEKGSLESLVPTLEMIQLPQLHTAPSCSRPPPTSPPIPQTPQMPTPLDSVSFTQSSPPHISSNHLVGSSPMASHPSPTIPPTSSLTTSTPNASSIPNPLPPKSHITNSPKKFFPLHGH